jgi:hypothetical protein
MVAATVVRHSPAAAIIAASIIRLLVDLPKCIPSNGGKQTFRWKRPFYICIFLSHGKGASTYELQYLESHRKFIFYNFMYLI